jgi:hypothetical protein
MQKLNNSKQMIWTKFWVRKDAVQRKWIAIFFTVSSCCLCVCFFSTFDGHQLRCEWGCGTQTVVDVFEGRFRCKRP